MRLSSGHAQEFVKKYRSICRAVDYRLMAYVRSVVCDGLPQKPDAVSAWYALPIFLRDCYGATS